MVVLVTESARLDDGLATLGRTELLQSLSLIRPIDGGACAVSILSQRLQSDDALLRYRAAWLLGLIGPPAHPAVGLLRDRLRDCDLLVRETSIRALGLIGPAAKAAVAELVKQLDDEDGRIRLAALDALKGIGPTPASLPGLAARVRAPSSAERVAAVGAIGLLRGTPDQIATLTKALKDSDPHVRYWATECLGRLGILALGAVPDLCYLLAQEQSSLVQARAVTAITRIVIATAITMSH
jgi:HEAT repeat protein